MMPVQSCTLGLWSLLLIVTLAQATFNIPLSSGAGIFDRPGDKDDLPPVGKTFGFSANGDTNGSKSFDIGNLKVGIGGDANGNASSSILVNQPNILAFPAPILSHQLNQSTTAPLRLGNPNLMSIVSPLLSPTAPSLQVAPQMAQMSPTTVSPLVSPQMSQTTPRPVWPLPPPPQENWTPRPVSPRFRNPQDCD